MQPTRYRPRIGVRLRPPCAQAGRSARLLAPSKADVAPDPPADSLVDDQFLKAVEQVSRGKAKLQVVVELDGDLVATARGEGGGALSRNA